MSGGVVGSIATSLQLSGLAGNLQMLAEGFKMIWKGKLCGLLLEHEKTSSWTFKKCV